MAKLILARHGETGWNVDKALHGRADASLDEAGSRQAGPLETLDKPLPLLTPENAWRFTPVSVPKCSSGSDWL